MFGCGSRPSRFVGMNVIYFVSAFAKSVKVKIMCTYFRCIGLCVVSASEWTPVTACITAPTFRFGFSMLTHFVSAHVTHTVVVFVEVS